MCASSAVKKITGLWFRAMVLHTRAFCEIVRKLIQGFSFGCNKVHAKVKLMMVVNEQWARSDTGSERIFQFQVFCPLDVTLSSDTFKVFFFQLHNVSPLHAPLYNYRIYKAGRRIGTFRKSGLANFSMCSFLDRAYYVIVLF